ncbi:DNA translocase FtsK [Labeo rohita]|uniref:DNA translocase FtsK n=1 Tax=Labeo rohita TaxID=84645 RepID=A0ABQ8N1H3_LABRO|nr:DNA translocase FtsK [Labeo rohita]
MSETQLSSESVTEQRQPSQQMMKKLITSVINTAELSSNGQIKELDEQSKEGCHVFNNTDEEKRSLVTKQIEKTDSMVEENRGQHNMYKEALRLEEEDILGMEESLSLAQKAKLVGAGVVGGLIGEAGAVAVVGCVARGAICLVAPIALIGAGVALMAEGGAIIIAHALKVCKEQMRNTDNA